MFNIKKFKNWSTFKSNFLSYFPKNYKDLEMQDQCWEWQGRKTNMHYGTISWGNRYYLAHRISYIIFNNLIPQNKIVRHICNNPSCVNPKHLLLGTMVDNSIDMVKANRQGNQKLNKEAIKIIKWMLKYKNHYGLSKKLASLYHINRSTIYKIKSGRIWYWINV